MVAGASERARRVDDKEPAGNCGASSRTYQDSDPGRGLLRCCRRHDVPHASARSLIADRISSTLCTASEAGGGGRDRPKSFHANVMQINLLTSRAIGAQMPPFGEIQKHLHHAPGARAAFIVTRMQVIRGA